MILISKIDNINISELECRMDGMDINFPLRELSELIALDEIDHVSNLYHSIWF